MKRFFLMLFILTTCLGSLLGQGITVTQPTAGEVYPSGTGSSITIAWTSTGIKETLRIALRKADGSGGYLLAAKHPYNKTPFDFTIPPEAPPGKYFIRIKSKNVKGKSGIFNLHTPKPRNSTKKSVQDLEITGLDLDLDNFRLKARIKSNIDNFSGKVKFKITSNALGKKNKESIQDLDVLQGRTQTINLMNVTPNIFKNKCGISFTVTVDPDNNIKDPDRSNNVKKEKFFKFKNQNGVVRRFRFLKREKKAISGQEILIEPQDCETFNNEAILTRIEIKLANCGGTALSKGKLHVRQYTEFECGNRNPIPIELSELIHSQQGIALASGETLLVKPIITLRRAYKNNCRLTKNEIRVYFETGNENSMNTDNRLTFRIRFSGF